MSTFLQFALLIVCAAAGIACAMGVAAHVGSRQVADLKEPAIDEAAVNTATTPSTNTSSSCSKECCPDIEKTSQPARLEPAIDDAACCSPIVVDEQVTNTHVTDNELQEANHEAAMPVALIATPAVHHSIVDEHLEQRTELVLPVLAQSSVAEPSNSGNIDRLNQLLAPLKAAATAAQPAPPEGTDAESIELIPPDEDSEDAAPVVNGSAPKQVPANVPTVKKAAKRPTISKIDGEGDNNLSIHIQETDIRDVLDLLSEQGGLNILASNSVQGKVSASLSGVDIDTALSAILKSTGFTARRDGQFIYIGTPADFQNLNQLNDRVSTRIYRPNYVKATELQTLVTPLLTPTIGMASVTTPSEVGIAPDSEQAGGNNFAGTDALLVRDYEAVLRQVDQVFQELDKRPLQVAIEAMILSVRLNDKNSLGVDFRLLRDRDNVLLSTGSPLTNLGQVSLQNGGLKFGFLDSNLGVFISALETIGDTNIIATPHLMCLNKHRAQILIGSRLGYVSTSVTETSTTQSVQFLEVGTQLRLRPFISGDGLIRMEVHPELSTGAVRIEGGFTLPDKEVTEVTTNIMVRDGATLIIGGLVREELDTNGSQVPFLGSAPWIGFLFRNRTETTERREIIVLVTPRIVYDPHAAAEGEKAACEFHRRQLNYADQMSPIGTRYLGRKYFRIAQDAWAARNKHAALKYVGLALSFDPLNRAALDLRADIYSNNHTGDHSSLVPPQAVIGPEALDSPQLAPWLLDGLQTDAQATDIPAYEEGMPGSMRTFERTEAF